ncbi:M48 family metallopeptidase [Nonlabens xiamenensis]|uniref:M48 family metallopeptidase n=1 Tax=Nonlabens xiamenensis TaxID=2341043 RepID=UPI000F60B8F8|nr:M48 family metallopeptidase [Nonlabens xiamenensis]
MNSISYYPPSPAQVPQRFTKLPSSYKIKATLAIAAVILFFMLYAALVTAMVWLLYQAVMYPIVSINKLTILLKIGAVAGAGMLLAFTLKFIFKLKNIQPDNRIRIDLDKNPVLKEFVMEVCRETGAPKPKHVFVDPDVNAYVSYSNLWMSLIFPTRKNLTIGLGLVACLNLTEFKAVIAHEFGHFAQRSMRIGSYIISANTIIHDMIYSRDSWDNALDNWRRADLRLAVAAWVITPVIWIIRQILALFYQFLNLVYSSLSREMEFNADKVAISTTGSEAIISSLWKLDHGAECWNATLNHAYLAGQKGMGVDNVYHHNDIAFSKKKALITESLSQMPLDERGGKLYFSTSEHSKVGMYASHPPNDLRETNAKTPYVECELDERSAWELFAEKEKIQKQLTTLVYEKYLNNTIKDPVSADAFQSFITTENAGAELLEEYHDAFDDRFVFPPTEEKMLDLEVDHLDLSQQVYELKSQLKTIMYPINQLKDQLSTIQAMASGQSKLKTFEYNNTSYRKKDLPLAYEVVQADREDRLNNDFKDWDLRYFGTHYHWAKANGKDQELLKKYVQHERITSFFQSAIKVRADLMQELAKLQEQGEVTEAVLNLYADRVGRSFSSLNADLARFTAEDFVPIPNIDSIDDLKESIVTGGAFSNPGRSMFQSGKFDQLMHELEMAINHLQRIDKRSMASILQFHEELKKS